MVENANPGNPFVTSAGRVQQLQLWNRPLTASEMQALSAIQSHSEPRSANTASGLLASYDFSGRPPFKDQEGI